MGEIFQKINAFLFFLYIIILIIPIGSKQYYSDFSLFIILLKVLVPMAICAVSMVALVLNM
jgi:hypothetical protein